MLANYQDAILSLNIVTYANSPHEVLESNHISRMEEKASTSNLDTKR